MLGGMRDMADNGMLVLTLFLTYVLLKSAQRAHYGLVTHLAHRSRRRI